MPTISSERPKPYTGAVSISVMPRSTAERMVWTDSSRSVFPPHIHPPMAHVPRAMRDAVIPDVPIRMVSMSFLDAGFVRHSIAAAHV